MNSAAHCEHGHYRGVHCPHGCYIVDATGEWSNTKKMADTLRAENEALKKERDKAVAACNLGIRPDIYEKRIMERDAVRAELAEAKTQRDDAHAALRIVSKKVGEVEAELTACREANEAMRAALQQIYDLVECSDVALAALALKPSDAKESTQKLFKDEEHYVWHKGCQCSRCRITYEQIADKPSDAKEKT